MVLHPAPGEAEWDVFQAFLSKHDPHELHRCHLQHQVRVEELSLSRRLVHHLLTKCGRPGTQHLHLKAAAIEVFAL